MSNFNEFFKNKGLKTIVDKFFDRVDAYNPKNKITNLKYEIVQEPPYPASYYIENDLTASHKVKITYDLNDDGVERETEFEIPKEIDGTFIIEGAYRISTNKLGNDYDCRMKFLGAGEHIINFDYDRRYDIDKKVLKIRRQNFNLNGNEKPLEIHYDQIDEYEDKELLRLTPKQIKKLEIKLDLDYKPEFITRKLINECIAFGDDRLKDLIIDKSINSVSQGFMQFLFRDNNGRNYWSARKRIMTYFAKYNKLQDQTNSITTLAYRFWKGNSGATSKELQVPPGVNAINLESLKSKITIDPTVAYNITMSDLIDLSDTPIFISCLL